MTAHLCLGTAAWGSSYNGREPPSDAELAKILETAHAHSIRWLDTAVAYGATESRLYAAGAHERFRIIVKLRTGAGWQEISRFDFDAAVMLAHVPGAEAAVYLPAQSRGAAVPYAASYRALLGASVYTPAQAIEALNGPPVTLHGTVIRGWRAEAIQVPWNLATASAAWDAIRDRAYADGVLFFGRQPFDRGRLLQDKRAAFRWALETNPRGWCVVGVETAAQVEDLCQMAADADI